MKTVFAYGSLINPIVRQMVVGREVAAEADSLSDFIQVSHSLLPYPSVEKAKGFVRGITFEVTDEELKKLDRYETSHYKQIEVKTKSGKTAICYTDSLD